MTSATERLRALLDERGVEWWETTSDCHCVFTWWESPTFGKVHAMDNEDGTLFMACLNNCDFTPEQAIDATLGRGTCHNVEEAQFPWSLTCSGCGTHSITEGLGFNYCPNCGRKVVG